MVTRARFASAMSEGFNINDYAEPPRAIMDALMAAQAAYHLYAQTKCHRQK